jgi:hypothetical protein
MRLGVEAEWHEAIALYERSLAKRAELRDAVELELDGIPWWCYPRAPRDRVAHRLLDIEEMTQRRLKAWFRAGCPP